ncbi:MAG: hypothetical protein ACJARI_003050 [Bacteroidia bacterium]|jgi:hypothetical protein
MVTLVKKLDDYGNSIEIGVAEFGFFPVSNSPARMFPYPVPSYFT